MTLSKEDPVNAIRFFNLKAAPALMVFLLAASVASSAAAPAADRERAAAALEQDLKGDPNNPELWLHLGFAYRKVEKITQAQAAFEKVIALNPQEKDAYFMLALIYESQHRDPDAQKAWNTYLTLENDANKRSIAEKHIHHLAQ